LSTKTKNKSVSVLAPSLSFSSHAPNTRQLVVTCAATELPIPSFVPLFADVPNFFDAVLPTDEYKDLSRIIEKFSYLNPKRVLPLVQKWKSTLEQVQVALGKLESQDLESEQLFQKILTAFGVNENFTEKLSNMIILVFSIRNTTFFYAGMGKIEFTMENLTEESFAGLKGTAETVNFFFKLESVVVSKQIPVEQISVSGSSGHLKNYEHFAPSNTLKYESVSQGYVCPNNDGGAWIVYDLSTSVEISAIQICNTFDMAGMMTHGQRNPVVPLKYVKFYYSDSPSGEWEIKTNRGWKLEEGKNHVIQANFGKGQYWKMIMNENWQNSSGDCGFFLWIKFFKSG